MTRRIEIITIAILTIIMIIFSMITNFIIVLSKTIAVVMIIITFGDERYISFLV